MSKLKQFLTEGFANEKSFTNDLQILRLAVQAELDAINLYEQLANKTTKREIKQVLLDVAFEEKVHVEEFEELIEKFDPEIDDAENQAEDELDDMRI